MEKHTNTKKLVEVGLNKYGQRLDEFNEFGQSLEAETWHFDGAFDVTVASLPSLECLIRPAKQKEHSMTKNMNSTKRVEVGLNKYGQRLDEFNEFGQSLEAEAWYFDGALELPVALTSVLESIRRAAKEKEQIMTENMNSTKRVEVGLNRYGQRLDEFDEFGQSLEAEAWYFESAFEAPVALVPAVERKSRPAKEKRADIRISTSHAAAHRRAA
ncbi:hypothetical protein EG832_01200 [bacterium]|nr:hypothetical protein [bacterium]